MDGHIQEWYPKKNWSSLIIYNCEHIDVPKLNINSVANQTPKWLHRFEWIEEEHIGEIPKTFNYLLGYYNDDNEPMAVHLTDGGPWHNDWYEKKIPTDDKYYNEWIKYLNEYEKSDLQNFLKS